MLTALIALGWYWAPRQVSVPMAHDHGENLIHAHEHSHRGLLGHDHRHPDVTNVTHSHSHQHGHFHTSAAVIEPVGKLMELGHVHGDSVTVYWVDALQQGAECQLRFYSECEGDIQEINPDSNTLKGEFYLELKSLGPVTFTRQTDRFVASLPADTPGFSNQTILIPEIAIGGEVFDLKFQLPDSAAARED